MLAATVRPGRLHLTLVETTGSCRDDYARRQGASRVSRHRCRRRPSSPEADRIRILRKFSACDGRRVSTTQKTTDDANAPTNYCTAKFGRKPQKIAPARGITSKWAVLWPKWPCPKVPFPPKQNAPVTPKTAPEPYRAEMGLQIFRRRGHANVLLRAGRCKDKK